MNRCAEFLKPAAFKVGSQRQEDNGRLERTDGKGLAGKGRREREESRGRLRNLTLFPGLFH